MARKNFKVGVEGAEGLNRALKAVGDRTTGQLLEKAVRAGAELIAEEARRMAPRDSGDLAEGITVEPTRLQQGRAQIDIGPGKREWYGRLVELGTEKMAAKPFLRPAFDTKADEARDAVANVLRKALKELLK